MIEDDKKVRIIVGNAGIMGDADVVLVNVGKAPAWSFKYPYNLALIQYCHGICIAKNSLKK